VPLGFVPKRLEEHRLQDQQNLFVHADVVVAPHRAGLTNLLHAPGVIGDRVDYGWRVFWCFRHLAAIRALRYDCIIGQQFDMSAQVNARP
jgi:2-phospho-L-lactate guanylyltransferase (CobY/MobA/RfbA family)